MKKILALAFLLFPLFSHAAVTGGSSSSPEKPSPATCAYQERIERGVWRCYSSEEWGEKELEMQREDEERQAAIDAFLGTWYGKLILVAVVVIFSLIVIYAN